MSDHIYIHEESDVGFDHLYWRDPKRTAEFTLKHTSDGTILRVQVEDALMEVSVDDRDIQSLIEFFQQTQVRPR